MAKAVPSQASFRDPSGFVFERDGEIYRQINGGFESDIRLLVDSGLYHELAKVGLIVEFTEAPLEHAYSETAGMVIRQDRIDIISYPFEWCFSQLKDAALLTLEIMKRALAKDMILKDASAYNVQFQNGSPIFIDTLSFEKYEEGKPWIAYKQFCQHFLAPLAMIAHVDVRLGALLQTNLDGIPLDLASALLPLKTKFSPGLMGHLHLHAKAQEQKSSQPGHEAKISKTGLLALIDSLKGTVLGLQWKPVGTEWGEYYSETNYSPESFSNKGHVVQSFLSKLPTTAKTCCDLGANNGEFSRLAVERGLKTIALDIDPAAVEKCYLAATKEGNQLLMPLLQDLRNPTPNYGWASNERDGLSRRVKADVVLALALIHHLAIGNNVPLRMVAEYFASFGEYLIVEFVPKEDSQIQRMLVARKDIFSAYTQTGFETAFSPHFDVLAKEPVSGTARTIYFMKRTG